ncbi:MAG TPA: antitoxin [Desulfuromonadales bacterium]|nr:antitoxin [Desulfuromonadales bacterium]
MKYTGIYRAALEKWGEEAQYDQAIEECAELITALKHYKRNRVGRQEVVDELADLTLMIGQLSWMFGEEDVEAAVSDKLKKLGALLDSP